MDREFGGVWAAINLWLKAARDFPVFLAVGVFFPEKVQIHVTKEGYVTFSKTQGPFVAWSTTKLENAVLSNVTSTDYETGDVHSVRGFW